MSDSPETKQVVYYRPDLSGFIPGIHAMQLIGLALFIIITFILSEKAFGFGAAYYLTATALYPVLTRLATQEQTLKIPYPSIRWRMTRLNDITLGHNIPFVGGKSFSMPWPTMEKEIVTKYQVPLSKHGTYAAACGVGLLMVVLASIGIPFALNATYVAFQTFYEVHGNTLNAALSSIAGWATDVAPFFFKDTGNANIVVMLESFTEAKALGKAAMGGLLGLSGSTMDIVFKVIMVIILTMLMLKNWQNEMSFLRSVVTSALKNHPNLCNNTLNFFAHFQDGLSRLAVGFMRVWGILFGYYLFGLLVLPVGLGFVGVVSFAVLLGFITAVPKIGGLVATFIVAPVLTLVTINNPIGWSWLGLSWTYNDMAGFMMALHWMAVVTYALLLTVGAILSIHVLKKLVTLKGKYGLLKGVAGTAAIALLAMQIPVSWMWSAESTIGGIAVLFLFRLAMLMLLAKIMGFSEATYLTPRIIGKELDVTKMFVVTVVIFSVMASFYLLFLALAIRAWGEVSRGRSVEDVRAEAFGSNDETLDANQAKA